MGESTRWEGEPSRTKHIVESTVREGEELKGAIPPLDSIAMNAIISVVSLDPGPLID